MEDAIIGLVIDRSGSMRSMWDEAVAGVNTFIKEQAESEGRAWITLNYFDNFFGQRHLAWAAEHIPELSATDDEIHPRGMTALVDATLKTIEDNESWLADNPWFTGKVFVVVVTDGIENASKHPASTLKEKISECEGKGWEFIYLAANVDLEQTGKDLGFKLGSSLGYTGQTVQAAYGAATQSVLRSRAGGDADFSQAERQKTSTGK